MEFLFSYILQELTVEKLKELDNNSDGILEISDFLNCIPDSTSITFSLYLLIFGMDKDGNMQFNEELDPERKGRAGVPASDRCGDESGRIFTEDSVVWPGTAGKLPGQQGGCLHGRL